MASPLRWGIIGTGEIASDFAAALHKSACCEVVNAVGSAPGRAQAFADRFDLPNVCDTIEQLLADDQVDAVYIATPHPMHERLTIACLRAGKHVLCEKPITVDAAGAERVINAASEQNVFLMEAFMYRCHPLTAKLIQVLQSGAIGEARHIRADFGFHVPRRPEHRLFNPDLGGGAILDVGGYPVSFARLVAGIAAGNPFEQPSDLCATCQRGPTGVDELATAQLTFPSGVSAQITAAVHHPTGTAATVFGTAGSIHLPDPWVPGSDRHGLTTHFELRPHDGPVQQIEVTTDQATYAIEAELVANAIQSGKQQADWPAMSWQDSLGNMQVLDEWRKQLGIVVAAQGERVGP
ncbi:MAG: Gfo/Idh/MocA family oxidoreductase [Planctomycetota bacterium]